MILHAKSHDNAQFTDRFLKIISPQPIKAVKTQGVRVRMKETEKEKKVEKKKKNENVTEEKRTIKRTNFKATDDDDWCFKLLKIVVGKKELEENSTGKMYEKRNYYNRIIITLSNFKGKMMKVESSNILKFGESRYH